MRPSPPKRGLVLLGYAGKRNPRVGDARSRRLSLDSFLVTPNPEGDPNAATALSRAVSDCDGDGVRRRRWRRSEVRRLVNSAPPTTPSLRRPPSDARRFRFSRFLLRSIPPVSA